MVKTLFEKDLDKALQRLNRYISLNNRSEFEYALEALEFMRFGLEHSEYKVEEQGMSLAEAKQYFVQHIDEFLDTQRGKNCREFSEYNRLVKYRLLALCEPFE